MTLWPSDETYSCAISAGSILESLAYHDNANVRVGLGGCCLQDGKYFAGEDEGADDAAKHRLEW